MKAGMFKNPYFAMQQFKYRQKQFESKPFLNQTAFLMFAPQHKICFRFIVPILELRKLR
jgi:hypothetical protein